MHWKDAGRLPTLRTFLDQAIAMRTEPSTHPPLPRRPVLLMAAATGLAVASNYYA
ncbi:MFS transporter, partial [Xanthomonas oryzae pv. oryzae]